MRSASAAQGDGILNETRIARRKNNGSYPQFSGVQAEFAAKGGDFSQPTKKYYQERSMLVSNLRYCMALLAAGAALMLVIAPASADEDDKRIESSIRDSYVFTTYLKDDAISVTSNNGAVTLAGTVNMDYHKALAAHTVEGLPGVKSVDNRLELKSKSPLENSDAWVKSHVTTALLFHRNTIGAKTEVYVQEGIVTLRGEATNKAQKDLTTEYVKDVVGVKDAKNEMTVPKVRKKAGKKNNSFGEKIDDASISAQVKMTLLYHRSTSALNTMVKTNDGTVTLSGKAKNASEKVLATKLANDVRGVKSVQNQMTIE